LGACSHGPKINKSISEANWDALKEESLMRWDVHRLATAPRGQAACYQGDVKEGLGALKDSFYKRAKDSHYWIEIGNCFFLDKKFSNEEIIKCKKIGGNEKPDLSISIKNIIKNCSYKTGKNISVHQEKLESFIEFSKTLKATEKEINAIKFYIWGDGTYDGSGKKNNRKEKWEIIRKDINTLSTLKSFFYLNRIEIINRILNIGRYFIKTDFLIKQKEKNNFFIVVFRQIIVWIIRLSNLYILINTISR
jgi:hypothetical protein